VMLAGDIMQKKVFTINQTAPIYELTQLLIEKKISGVPVCDGFGAVVGIVSQRDLATMVSGNNIGDIMTRKLITIAPTATIEEAARLMYDNRIKRLPVFAEGKMVGIITPSDIIRAVATGAIVVREKGA
jgi:CBS domain-containing protein